MGDLENIVLTDDGSCRSTRPSMPTTWTRPWSRSQIMGNELMVDGVVSKDKKVAMLVAELGTKQDDAQAQLRASSVIVREHRRADTEPSIPSTGTRFSFRHADLHRGPANISHDLAVLFPIVFLRDLTCADVLLPQAAGRAVAAVQYPVLPSGHWG